MSEAQCPHFDLQIIARTCSVSLWAKVSKRNSEIEEYRIRKIAEAENMLWREKEIARLQRMSEEERAVEKHAQHIEDRICNLRCPRCELVFVDFVGCFALKCPSCSCGFCALCLADCGSDAHSHVAQCGAGRLHSTYFGTDSVFANAQQVQRQLRLDEYLRTISSSLIHNLVCDRIAVSARDLSLKLPSKR
jgi:hypothetical protein